MIEQWLRDYVPGKWLTRGGEVVDVRTWGNRLESMDRTTSRLHLMSGIFCGDGDRHDLIAPVGVWIPHDGGECPVPAETIVQTKLKCFPNFRAGGPVTAGACKGWAHTPGEGLYISHFLILDPTSPPELETWTEVSKPTIANSPIVQPAAFQHVSDAAADSVSSEVAGMLDGFRELCSRHDVALRTREEWEALEQITKRVSMTNEREKELLVQLAAKDAIIQDLHKQLRGQRRDDGKNRQEAEDQVGQRDDMAHRPAQANQAGACMRSGMHAQVSPSLTTDYWQDARLGTQLPPGDPVEPMSAKSWKRSGV